jgi:hypothetical protein
MYDATGIFGAGITAGTTRDSARGHDLARIPTFWE